MKRTLLTILVCLVAVPSFAIDRTDCRAVTHLGALYELRSLMMRRYASSSDVQTFVDRRVDDLREPTGDGGYRWVRYVRPTENGPVDKHVHTVRAVNGASDPDSFEATGHHAYAVRVVVPSKRSLFKGNNPVYVGDVRISYSNADGGTRSDVVHINKWMAVDTSQTFDLHGIYDNVIATAPMSVEKRDQGEAVGEIHFMQAVQQDDPANPAYDTIRALQRIREMPDPASVDAEIAALEATLFPNTESVPVLTIIRDLRRADELMRSSKGDEQEKGDRLLKETLRRLR